MYLVYLVILVIFQIVVAITIGRDASRRYPDGSSAPFGWFIGSILLTPLMAIPYFIARPQTSSSEVGVNGGYADDLSKIERLQDLKERGAITEKEFEEKKKEFL